MSSLEIKQKASGDRRLLNVRQRPYVECSRVNIHGVSPNRVSEIQRDEGCSESRKAMACSISARGSLHLRVANYLLPPRVPAMGPSPVASRSSLIDHSFPVSYWIRPSIRAPATDALETNVKPFYACYLLKSIRTPRACATYVGSTPNPYAQL